MHPTEAAFIVFVALFWLFGDLRGVVHDLKRASESKWIVGVMYLPTCAILLSALVASLPAVLRALRTDPSEILRSE
jgi:hypothetical protein